METFLIKAAQLILSLSILVIVHEFGHFIFARIYKVRVEKFYLFFDAWFALFRYKPKNSETEYGIGWLPLGGYCKISGMIDESMDKEQMAQPPQPFEFRSKSAGKRLMIMIAGVLFNFLLALFIYSMILFKWGETYVPLDKMTNGMYYSETFHNIGFQDGDVLLMADSEKLDRFGENSFRKVVESSNVTVLRNGVQTVIPIPEGMMQRILRDKKGFADPNRIPMMVRELTGKNTPAALAGLQPGDSIVAINGTLTPLFEDAAKILEEYKDADIQIDYYRNGQAMSTTAHTDENGKLGFYLMAPADIYGTYTKTYGFFESFPAGIRLGVNTLKGYVSDMKYVFTKEGASSLGGFGTIGGLFPAQWNWKTFWERTAFLSIILAFMNILPIPALDGGHVMFLLYEVIARRKPSDKFLEYAQIVGMLLLFGLLIYANGNDIVRYFFK
ncbi:regulator of sigma E protease [Parabacteroides sp. PFB2-12]|uniref:RIP metalloprotease RseP n=1 Tax=unclassified Parabacteroides TaxID=2649774 RepID=UPI00247366CB|nr:MULTISPECIES: RIP metalloprotease RseP [unclassified Parabacteroides]MDH6341227.1 regulator of sigma E protease [Parabacteroides sp. PM6-13]MDH6389417.1 regulator of sigma E protease [Parabacteroides sp. PFB2-12]